jgi:hypothetical protein
MVIQYEVLKKFDVADVTFFKTPCHTATQLIKKNVL